MPALPCRRSLVAAVALAAALALLLGACGGTSAPRSTPAAPTPSAERYQHYVALGDSYSAAPMVPVTDVAGGCFRSSGNYPALVAKALGSTLVDRTCGGADTADVDRSQGHGIPPQRTALGSGTELVTVGLGGNDESVFSRLVFSCTGARAQDPQGAPCRAAQQQGAGSLLAALRRTSGRVAAVLREVRRLSPRATVLLVGYPHIVDARHRCAALPLARGDYAFAESVNRALDTSLRRAARVTGTTYVDVYTATTGHDICARDPWINGDRTDRSRALEYHPFAAEQQAVARLVLATLHR